MCVLTLPTEQITRMVRAANGLLDLVLLEEVKKIELKLREKEKKTGIDLKKRKMTSKGCWNSNASPALLFVFS